MSVENTTTKVVYAGNGVTKEWPVPFQYARSEDIALLIDDGTTQTDITSNYQIVVNDGGDTSVTYPVSGTAVAAGNKLAIYRLTPRTQVVDLVYGGAFAPDVLENDGLDLIVMMTQELSRDVERAVKLAITSEDSPDALVASIYASRDAAAASASAASVQTKVAEAQALAAANSASTAAQTVATAAAGAVSAATTQANAAHDSALAAAQSAAAAESASSGLAPRMDAVELKNTQQETRLDAVEAVTDLASAIPGAGKIPKADSNQHLNPGWLGTMLCNARSVLTTSGTYTAPCSGWYRVMCIGGGGAGGSGGGSAINGGGQGGTTTFKGIAAIGGSGGGKGYAAYGGYAGATSGGSGQAGKVVVRYVHLEKDEIVDYIVGAGGIAGASATGAGAGPEGGPAANSSWIVGGGARGASHGIVGRGSNDNQGANFGGSGDPSGTGYGGGGPGGNAVQSVQPVQLTGPDGAGSTNTSTGAGGNGGNGVIILDYYNPSITS